jgi:glycerophosphoryl diester phosphodiesterase
MGHGGPIKLLITGHRPWKSLLTGNERYITADGDIRQSADSLPPHILERVSDPYSQHFSWKGHGAMPAKQKAKLDTLVKVAHDHGRQIRFYGMPQDENVWRTLLDAGVDWINVDELAKFALFYKDYLRTHGEPKSCHCVRM